MRRFLWIWMLSACWSCSIHPLALHAESQPTESPPAAEVTESANAPAETNSAEPESPTASEAIQLHYQDGTVVLPNNLATLTLPPELRFLDAAQAKFVIEQLWGNPPGNTYLGMIVPANAGPDTLSGWGVVIDFDSSGYISDKDAQSIDYQDLLKSMQEREKDINAERSAQGFDTIHLVGWAKPPHYDAATKKLHWAKEIQFGEDPEHTLNYAIRVLGRRGYLELNLVGAMSQLAEIDAMVPKVLSAIEFNSGERYADFNSATDTVSQYGIAALVAGGVAAKAGLFKGLIALLLAGKKLIILGIAGVGALVAKLWKKSAKSE